MSEPEEIVRVDRVECRYEPARWAFADENATAIEVHWQALVAAKPKLFNGRVLVQHRGAVARDPDGAAVFRGAYLETDFKVFQAWRDFGFPPAGVRNGFGMAALESGDGAFILGEMAAHTANAGWVYFPSGTPDPSDVRDGAVDIEGSVRRELFEETGLAADDVVFDPGFTVMIDAVRAGFMKRVRSPEPAERLVARIHAFLARERNPELARMHVVRQAADIDDRVIPVVADYLRAALIR